MHNSSFGGKEGWKFEPIFAYVCVHRRNEEEQLPLEMQIDPQERRMEDFAPVEPGIVFASV